MTKSIWTGWSATLLAVLLLTGCTEESTPGGPGATPATPGSNTTADDGMLDDAPEAGEPINEDATFELGMPTGATNVKQGEAQTVTISIDRGDEFAGEVNVTLTPPQGITVDPQQFTFPAGQDEMEVQVTAGPTATPGEQIIRVEGRAPSGPPALGELKIEVTEADSDSPPANLNNPDPAAPANPAPPANPANPEEGAPPVDNP
jgi:hypothetical protein